MSASRRDSNIKQIVKKHNIQKFCFVLSIDNKIVLDALWKVNFSKIGALSSFQNEIRKEKELSKKIFKSSNSQFAILSYFLNKKIKFDLILVLLRIVTKIPPIKLFSLKCRYTRRFIYAFIRFNKSGTICTLPLYNVDFFMSWARTLCLIWLTMVLVLQRLILILLK